MPRGSVLLLASLLLAAALSATLGLGSPVKEKRGWTLNSAGYLLGPHALDSHRSFQDKHGVAGKRELEPEDEARPGERTLIPGRAGQWGYWPPTTPNPQPSLSWAPQNLSAARTRHPKPENKILGRPQGLRACPALGGREGRPSDAPRCPGLGQAPGRHPCPLWFLGSFDRPLAENNIVRTIIEFLTFLHLKDAGALKRLPSLPTAESAEDAERS
uniref:Galanin peptides n=1 Tax=Bos indicus x Bos taurus TaxID=30522 RepID=A0A4W2GIX6_BOBOX